MALVLMVTQSLSDKYRISPDTLSAHMSSSDYVSSSIGYVFSTTDYPEDVCTIISSSFSTEIYGETFEAVSPVYNATTPIIPSEMLVAAVGQFVPRRNFYVSSSFADDSTQDVSTFIARSSDYTGLTASISTLDTIELGTTSNVEPDEPPFPDPPPVGPYDMNRFRKTYTHVRVRPRIRKYSSSP